MIPRLKETYQNEIAPNLKTKFGYKNINMSPKLKKIVIKKRLVIFWSKLMKK